MLKGQLSQAERVLIACRKATFRSIRCALFILKRALINKNAYVRPTKVALSEHQKTFFLPPLKSKITKEKNFGPHREY